MKFFHFQSLDAHDRLIWSIVTACLAFFAFQGHTAFTTQIVGTWDVFAATYLIFTTSVILLKDPYEVRKTAKTQDASRTFIFGAVVIAATASVIAVFLLLATAKGLPPTSFALHFGLSITAIFLSWGLVHTLFCLRYAHHFYIDASTMKRDDIEGGLEFPGNENPDYMDFAYFAFIIGMTCQVSDVQISSKSMRRLALIHGLISFLFNTAILALFVNIVASLV